MFSILGQGYVQASEKVLNEIYNSDEVAKLSASTPANPTLIITAVPTTDPQLSDDCDGSSTGSSDDIGVLDGCEIMPKNKAVMIDEDLDMLEESVRFPSPTPRPPRPVTGGRINIIVY